MITNSSFYKVEDSLISTIRQLGPLDDLLYFDIETTGFSRTSDTLVSITFLHFINENSAKVIQYFAETPSDEVELLNSSIELFIKYPLLVTYNGHAFDIPYLNSKYQYYNMFLRLNKCMCFDLFVLAKKILKLDNYKLKTVEKALHIHRQDSLSGMECTLLYKQFQITKDFSIPTQILQHNYEDVINLLHLTQVANTIVLNELPPLTVCYIQFQSNRFYLSSFDIKSSSVIIRLWTTFKNIHQHFRGDGLRCSKENENEWLIEFKVKDYLYNNQVLSIPNCDSPSPFSDLSLDHQIIRFNGSLVKENVHPILLSLIYFFF